MATLSVTRSYADGEVLVRADLDAFLDDIETFINVTKIDDDNIQTSGITASTKLVNGSITSAKIKNAAVTTSKIADDAVTKEKIASTVAGAGLSKTITEELAVNVDDSTIEINSDTLRLKDGGITTAKILDANVTKAKLEPLGQQESASSGTYTNATDTETTVCSVSITTVGRPVMVLLASADTSDPPTAAIKFSTTSGSIVGISAYLSFCRDSTRISAHFINGAATVVHPYYYMPASLIMIDTPVAGTYTYSLKASLSSTDPTKLLSIINYKLVVVEL